MELNTLMCAKIDHQSIDRLTKDAKLFALVGLLRSSNCCIHCRFDYDEITLKNK